MAENHGMTPTPDDAVVQVTTLDAGPVPTVLTVQPPVNQNPPHGIYGQTPQPAGTKPGGPAPAGAPGAATDPVNGIGIEGAGAPGAATDPVNGIGIEGEEVVWEARYSMRNFLGRIVSWSTLSIVWFVGAVYTWGYDHSHLAVPLIIFGVVLLLLWIGLINQMIQAHFGHYYRLTTRRLFVSTGILNRERDQLELLRVQDVFTRQTSLLERVLGLGTITVVSDQKNLPNYTLLGVADPRRIHDLIWHHARAEQDQRNVRVEGV